MSAQDTGAGAINPDEAQLDTLREGIDDPVVLKDQLRKEAEARRQLTARAKDAEEKLRTEREARIKLESTVQTNQQSPAQEPFVINDEVVDLRLDGYSKSEVDWIMKNGGRKSLEDKTSYTAIAINAKREQERAEQAASQVTETSGQSDIERKYTQEQLKAMSVKELEAILPHSN